MTQAGTFPFGPEQVKGYGFLGAFLGTPILASIIATLAYLMSSNGELTTLEATIAFGAVPGLWWVLWSTFEIDSDDFVAMIGVAFWIFGTTLWVAFTGISDGSNILFSVAVGSIVGWAHALVWNFGGPPLIESLGEIIGR